MGNEHARRATSVFPDDASPYAKELVARDMGRRAAAFTRASILLSESDGDPYVWRHELCVGVELALKSALLRRNFDEYWPRLRSFGHRLVTLADEASSAFGLAAPHGALRAQLVPLADMYANHRLRYSSGLAILTDPNSIECDRVLRRLLVVLTMLGR